MEGRSRWVKSGRNREYFEESPNFDRDCLLQITPTAAVQVTWELPSLLQGGIRRHCFTICSMCLSRPFQGDGAFSRCGQGWIKTLGLVLDQHCSRAMFFGIDSRTQDRDFPALNEDLYLPQFASLIPMKQHRQTNTSPAETIAVTKPADQPQAAPARTSSSPAIRSTMTIKTCCYRSRVTGSPASRLTSE